MRLDLTNAKLNVDLSSWQERVDEAHHWLHEKTGKGNDYVGWVKWPLEYDKEEVKRIKDLALRLKDKTDVLIVCGIGGSYLGARAALEMIRGLYPNDGPEIIFVGNTFSATYLNQVLEHVKDKEIVVNVISKSGTTTETSVSFRLFKELVEKKYSKEEAKERIIATTDKARGTLKALADEMGYETFVIPDDIGGRYSVFTAVGLLPMAFAGIDPEEVLRGSKAAFDDFSVSDISKNIAYQYAIARRIMDEKGKSAEMFVTYELQLASIGEWWKQLFGESEGKDGLGILPTSATFSTDLHSLGQFIQQGRKCLFETLLWIDKMPKDITFPREEVDFDHMNYLAGKQVSWVNEMAMRGTLSAHVDDGDVPNIVIYLDDASAYSFGYMIYFFFKACGMSCYLLGVNPFDQPGVEVYKKKMFKLLGKE